MFKTLMTTGPQKRGVFRSFTKATEPVCCASADAAERGIKLIMELLLKKTNFNMKINIDLILEVFFI